MNIKLHTVKNSVCDAFIKTYKENFGNKKAMKQDKQKFIEQADTYLYENGFGGMDFFSKSEMKVLEELFYQTTVCGVQKIGQKTLSEKKEVSIATVNRAVKKIKETGLFIFARLSNGQAGKYVLVNTIHTLYKKAMSFLFPDNDNSIEKSFEKSSKPETPSAPRDEEANSVSTIDNHKDLDSLNKRDVTTSSQQDEYVKQIKEKSLKEYKDQAEEIAYQLPNYMSKEQKRAFEHALDLAEHKAPTFSAKGYFMSVYETRLKKILARKEAGLEFDWNAERDPNSTMFKSNVNEEDTESGSKLFDWFNAVANKVSNKESNESNSKPFDWMKAASKKKENDLTESEKNEILADLPY